MDANGLTLEVVDFEDGCTRFCRSTLKLGTVDLNEALRLQILSEERANAMLKLEHRLIGRCLVVTLV